MKKFIKSGLVVALCAMFVLPTVACTTSTLDNETRPFSMAIGAIDGNFNPFFYTAANDGTVISLTQASMLSTDSNGNISCGEDEPTVVKDYTITSYRSNGTVIDQTSANASNTAYTTYSFLIKNGMKFSDGEPLTIMDVLFSLYVNIDLAYTGSATLYSNDIQGLNAYREQDPTLTDDSTNSSASYFNSLAQQRITNIVNYCNNKTVSDTDQVKADIETVKELFYDEVTSDWTTADETFNSRDVNTFEYTFTEVWQYFYLMEGIIDIQTEPTQNASGSWITTEKKDADGKYVTTLDVNTTYAEDIEAAKNDQAAIAAYTAQGYSEETAKEYVVRDYCINNVWQTMTGGYATEDGDPTNKTGIAQIVQYWATASTALTEFAGQERTAYFSSLVDDEGNAVVQTIDGVTTERVTTFNGEKLGDTYDVLNVTINGVDPKAIWNFAFTVCPLHYYALNLDTVDANGNGGEWTYETVDSEGNKVSHTKNYVEAAMADYEAYKTAWANGDTSYQLTEFGVQCGNSDFFSEILNDEDKNKLPVGAGPYAASSSTFCDTEDATRESFYINKYVYYVRNEYFDTMGEGISKAKIRCVMYCEMGDNDVLTYLMAGEVDYGTPAATTDNQQQLAECKDYLDYSTSYYTNGYGYVGINPKYIPDETVRKVLMMTMNNNDIIKNYYGEDLADVIYRPMSKTSWAYPENATSYYGYVTNTDTIKGIMEDAGYYLNNDKIYTNGTYTCKITFTIAGDSSDHPAYDMFCKAEEILEQCGFDITVQTDANALTKLSTGTLEVWAAAWSSAIDPDMYQVYHMDSTASSVKNWNYTEILANPTADDWKYEYDIIVKLSDVIDKARETNNQDDRAAYYATALDYVMDLAVEFPTYQRKDNEVYNKNVLKAKSLNKNVSCYSSLIDRIWEIYYV